MQWLQENWFWLFVTVLFVGMHMGHGHGGHGGHGGHTGRGGHKGHGGPSADEGAEAGPAEGTGDVRHEHDEHGTGGRHAQH